MPSKETKASKKVLKATKTAKDDHKCQYFDPKKHRRCGLEVRRGQKYCFAHIDLISPGSQDRLFKIDHDGNKVYRVKCPKDPTHTVWEDRLKNHLGKCNAVRAEREIKDKQEHCAWFELNCNVKDAGEPHKRLGDETIDYDYWKQFIGKLVALYDAKFTEELPLRELPIKDGLEERYHELTNVKHLRQQSSLIGQLVHDDLFTKNTTYVEFGCGRSEFSRYLNRALDDHYQDNSTGLSYLFVDRDKPRIKMDRKLVEDSEAQHLVPPTYERLKVDIKDLVLGGAVKGSYIGISKHLCGVATDLTLRCILNCPDTFQGFLVAMCCRHCCYYDWLLPESKTYLNQFGIDESNFKYLRKMLPWATSGLNHGRESADHFSGLSLEERELVGLKMRRILDESRANAMRQHGFDVELVRYVPREVTFENTCMVVRPTGTGPAEN